MLISSGFFIVSTDTVDAATEGDYTYSTSGSPLVATITGYNGTGGAITIPSTLDGYTVMAIGDSAFDTCTSLTSVVIPNSVTSIGLGAFASCYNLTSINIPSDVKVISTTMFWHCSALSSVHFDSSGTVLTIGYNTFEQCTNLTSITLPNSVKTIYKYAFSHCTALTSITIPDSVRTIGWYAFEYCTNLSSVNISDNLTKVDQYTFQHCINLTSVNIGDKVGTIASAAFLGCTALSSITIPSSVTTIQGQVFQSCIALTSINFLGFVAPTSVDENWMVDTPAGVRGHAYSGSNFPMPNFNWNGLKMGSYLVKTAPEAPEDLLAYPGVAQVLLTWNAPDRNGGSDITIYHVYRSTTSHGPFTLISSPLVLNCTDTGLTNGLKYYYKVSAENAIGEGDNCTAIIVMVSSEPAVPTAPQDLHLSSSSKQVDLTWAAPISDGGSPIINYKVYRRTIFDGPFDLIASTSDMNYSDTGLTNNRSYYYQVSAVNDAGEGANCTYVATFLAFDPEVPEAPDHLVPVAGNAQVALTWDAPANDGGDPITGYRVYRSTTSNGIFELISSPSGLNCTDTDAINDQIYWYKVSTVNTVGEGANCTPVNATPSSQPTVPGIPRDLALVADRDQINLTWKAPFIDGNSPITAYKIYRSYTISGTYSLIASLSGLNNTDTGLSNNQSYYYQVSAVNAIGQGANCSPVGVFLEYASMAPGAPQGLTLIASSNQVNLAWSAPASDGVGPITGYKVYRSTTSNGTYGLISSPSVLNYTDMGLTNGQTYWYKISAVNVAGEGENCSPISVFLEFASTVPGTPEDLDPVAGNAQVILTWTAPTNNGGSPITGYKLYRSTTSNGTYQLISSPSVLIYTDTGLTNGQTYWYKISAVNAVGEGENSSTASITVPLPDDDTPGSENDSTMLIMVGIIAIALVIVAVISVMRLRKGKV
ncbi:MAG: leucine-rich repeat protein [Methanomassiliicoccales archaeon]|nr:leucine-rich repeat protein [Methanomassiliicoccales archaeon]